MVRISPAFIFRLSFSLERGRSNFGKSVTKLTNSLFVILSMVIVESELRGLVSDPCKMKTEININENIFNSAYLIFD